jgi:hypothetical protein
MAVVTAVCGPVRRADAQVTAITITSRAPFANGQTFGAIGPYEEIIGLAAGEIDPKDPRNARIADIELAPRQPNGRVAYRTTFTIRRPVDMSKLRDAWSSDSSTSPETSPRSRWRARAGCPRRSTPRPRR